MMERISNSEELRTAIIQFEIKQKEDELLLKKQLLATAEHLKPINLIKSSFKDLAASPVVPMIKENLLKMALSLATNYVVKSSFLNAGDSPIKKLLRTLLKFGSSAFAS